MLRAIDKEGNGRAISKEQITNTPVSPGAFGFEWQNDPIKR